MSGSISRRLYQRFLRLYPEPFRQEFGDEMLGMFEECRGTQGCCRLFIEVVFSAAKQQIRYVSTPMPKSEFLYSEVVLSPDLARILAIASFGAALIVSLWAGGGKPRATASWTMVRSEVLLFPIWGEVYTDAPEHKGRGESVLTARRATLVEVERGK